LFLSFVLVSARSAARAKSKRPLRRTDIVAGPAGMGTSRSKKRKTSPDNSGSKVAMETSPVQPEGLTEVGPKRRPWAAEEDDKLRQLVGVHGVKNWAMIATELHMRNGKQVR
jgi:hypothetical protein